MAVSTLKIWFSKMTRKTKQEKLPRVTNLLIETGSKGDVDPKKKFKVKPRFGAQSGEHDVTPFSIIFLI
jgi:hypothetical protein